MKLCMEAITEQSNMTTLASITNNLTLNSSSNTTTTTTNNNNTIKEKTKTKCLIRITPKEANNNRTLTIKVSRFRMKDSTQMNSTANQLKIKNLSSKLSLMTALM